MRKLIYIVIGGFVIAFALFNIYFAYICEQKIPVLTYHNIVSDEEYKTLEKDFFTTKVSTFKKQMNYLKKHNFKTLSLDEYNCWIKKKCEQPRKSVLITFDDGWSSVYKYALPILKENNQKAVSFLIYWHVIENKNHEINNPTSYLSLDMINDSIKEYPNLEYGSHSFAMHDRERHGKRSKEEMQKDIDTVKKYNESKYYAYPNGYTDAMYKQLLKENGYELAFSFGPYANSTRKDDHYDIQRLAAGDTLPYWKFVLKMMYRY